MKPLHMFFQRYQIHGKSMEPSYKDGDRVIIYKYEKIREGDIILFKKNAMTMVKRVAKIKNEKYLVKGDNWEKSTDSDDFGAIEKSDILGKIVMKY